MNYFMNTKIIFSINALWTFQHAIMFFDDGGFLWFTIGMISVFCFNMEISSAKKVLTGNGIGYLCLTAYIIWDEINLSEETPIPAIIIWALLSIWMLFVGLKKDSVKSE